MMGFWRTYAWLLVMCILLHPLNVNSAEDYSYFYGRITDMTQDGKIVRLNTENKNIKLFRSGDILKFKTIKGEKGKECLGYVRDTDDAYLVFSVTSYSSCWDKDYKMRIGTLLRINSERLFERLKDAKVFREVLKKRKEDFLSQLNDVNTWLWTFKQQKLKAIASYDQEIEKLKMAKQQEMSNLSLKRKDYLHLQRELKFRLDELDRDIEFYRIENARVLRDRWAMDRDLGKEFINPNKKVYNR